MAAQDHLGVQFHVDREDQRVWAMHPESGPIGSLDWIGTTDPKISSVFVNKPYRRQGIASGMYQEATRATGQPLRHSAHRTDMGDAWARSVGGELPANKGAEQW